MMMLLINAELVDVVDSPVVLGLLAANQLKEEATFDVKLIFSGIPEQIVSVSVLVTLTVGTTLTVTFMGLPGQEPVVEVGVMV
jgi:septum formation inhibitor-activating ATPase MinD